MIELGRDSQYPQKSDTALLPSQNEVLLLDFRTKSAIAREVKCMVNFYLLPQNSIVAIDAMLSSPFHSHVHAKVETRLAGTDLQSQLDKPLSAYQNAGFYEPGLLLVRFEDLSESCLKQSDCWRIVEKYQRLLGVVNQAAMQIATTTSTPQTVQVLAASSFPKQVLKALGQYHLLDVSGAADKRGKDFIDHNFQSSEVLAGPIYYSMASGTRYKSLDQLINTLDRRNDRTDFLARINELVKLMNPAITSESRNHFGKPQAQFLVLDSKNQEVNISAHAKIYRKLKVVHETAKKISPEQWEQPQYSSILAEKCNDLLSTFKKYVTPAFQSDNFENPVFVSALERLLRGKEAGLNEGGLFIPVQPINFGSWSRFGPERDPVCHFDYSFDIRKYPGHEALINSITISLPNAANSDWLVFYKLVKALSHQNHPANFARRLGEPRDESLIVEVGQFKKQPEYWALRVPPFHKYFWLKSKNAPRVQQLLKHFEPLSEEKAAEKLAALVRIYMRQQNMLTNELLKILKMPKIEHFKTLRTSTFDPSTGCDIKEPFLYRRLVSGSRLDLADLSNLNFDETKKVLQDLTKLMVVNLVAERSVFSFYEMFLNRDPINGSPNISTIATTESFCSSVVEIKNTETGNDKLRSTEKGLIAKDLKEKKKLYFEHAAILYGAALFYSLVPYRYGTDIKRRSNNSNLTTQLKPNKIELKITNDLVKVCAEEFVKSFYNIKKNKQPFLDATIREAERVNLAKYGGSPYEFNIGQHLSFPQLLLESELSEITGLVKKIVPHYEEIQQYYERLIHGIPITELTSQMHDELSTSLFSLISYNFTYPAIFKKIKNLLNNSDVQLGTFTITERNWLLSLAYISAWTKLVGRHNLNDMANFALLPETSETDFVNMLPDVFVESGISAESARKFYQAVNGLSEKLVQIEQEPTLGLFANKLNKIILNWSLGELNWKDRDTDFKLYF